MQILVHQVVKITSESSKLAIPNRTVYATHIYVEDSRGEIFDVTLFSDKQLPIEMDYLPRVNIEEITLQKTA
jgi:hypothetical protein